jgi:hypothetical protein
MMLFTMALASLLAREDAPVAQLASENRPDVKAGM